MRSPNVDTNPKIGGVSCWPGKVSYCARFEFRVWCFEEDRDLRDVFIARLRDLDREQTESLIGISDGIHGNSRVGDAS